jgi:integrase/recombinase XerC
MQHLQIFRNKEAAVVADHSNKIVKVLSDNYADLIRSMVAKSENTKKAYIRNVEHFMAFIQAGGVNAFTLERYRKALEDVPVANRTKNSYLAAAKALCKQATKYGILPVDITANVKGFDVSRGHVKDGLSEAEVVKVFRYIQNIKDDHKRRKLEAIFHLLAGEGLRQMEIRNLHTDDVNTADQYIRIRRKGKTEKETFFITPSSTRALEAYMADIPRGWLFPSSFKQGEPITLRYLRKLFTCPKYGVFAKCGIDGRSLHGFRHYNITKTLQLTNGNLSRTRKRSGHAGNQMLVVYDDERLSKEDVVELDHGFRKVLEG